MIIKIDGGETFEGTLEQFKGNYFSNATPSSIVEWATNIGSTVEFLPDGTPARICLFCVHFRYDEGQPDYSEVTPGYDASMECSKGKWCWKNFHDTVSEFRRKMSTAANCTDFVPQYD